MKHDTVLVGDNILETVVTDEDIARVVDTPVVENTGNPGYSKAVMKLFRRTKKVVKKVDAQSRISVAEMRVKRDDVVVQVAKVEHTDVKPAEQRTFADFIG